jgi:hypothetical protein
MHHMTEGFLMGCSHNDAKAGTEEEMKEGILKNHAYGILSLEEYRGVRLICLRNPWGSYEWKGM